MRAVILAGGKGTRLYPYSMVLPKPLVPIGDLPILDVVLRKLRRSGFKKVTLAVGYLSDLIKAYVGNGSRYGLSIDYSLEKNPLGTIGPLSLIKGLNETFLVMNGDLLTTLDLKEMLKQHKRSKSLATVAVKERELTVDYGVVKFDRNLRLFSHEEKPSLKYFVGIGICFFEPEVLSFIPKGRRFDFPDLVGVLLRKRISIKVYETDEYWRDIGRWEDYLAAQHEFPKRKKAFLKA